MGVGGYWRKDMKKRISELCDEISALPETEKIETINEVKRRLHHISPMRSEPVDCVIWVKADDVISNDYNPNAVAPPEMELLKVSILEDGYTQPIVTYRLDDKREVVDGFHRNRVGKECQEVRARIKGYLPVVTINDDRTDKADRIASTIRHNRARGKHKTSAMADIVVELKHRNWSVAKISKHLGMDEDEVLRLSQITGMAEAFADADFSKSWDIGFEENIEDIKFEDQDEQAN
jgi:ParB-like chromosome segregation protein Spo0J